MPDVLNQTFHDVDMNLSKLSEESDGKMHSGCTVVAALLRIEDEHGKQSFLPPDFDPFSMHAKHESNDKPADTEDSKSKRGSTSKLMNAIKSLSGASSHHPNSDDVAQRDDTHAEPKIIVPPPSVRRVLYCANAGDARGVLCRGGKSVRLTYDHKGSDKQEAKRITDAGGFVMSGRVNGVLAVTRSLGDSSMKEFVVGSPYTTETELGEDDEFLILACDGVRRIVDYTQTSWLITFHSYGMSLMTRELWTWSVASRTLAKRPRSCWTTHIATTRRITSRSWSYASEIRPRA